MLRTLRGAPVPRNGVSPGGEHRVITAKYNIANRRDLRTGSRLFYAARVEAISAESIALSAPVTGDLEEPVLVRVDMLGELRGFVAKRTRTGFVMSITATDYERAKLKIKIEWVEQIRAKKLVNRRQHDRFTPATPHSTLIFADGSKLRCFVVDMSASGAAVSARAIPAAGLPLALGKVVGRVVRHLPNGFAIRFVNTVDDIKVLEALLIKPSI
ncbi:MAG: hypothetical protein QOH32_442 [Bradyrhizobium sp.]|jgi:hypothetical protein|nr:hypothetical protein [Bradyrhizobium sp.]